MRYMYVYSHRLVYIARKVEHNVATTYCGTYHPKGTGYQVLTPGRYTTCPLGIFETPSSTYTWEKKQVWTQEHAQGCHKTTPTRQSRHSVFLRSGLAALTEHGHARWSRWRRWRQWQRWWWWRRRYCYSASAQCALRRPRRNTRVTRGPQQHNNYYRLIDSLYRTHVRTTHPSVLRWFSFQFRWANPTPYAVGSLIPSADT